MTEQRTLEVPVEIYKKLRENEKKAKNNKPYSLEEMIFYDELFGD